MPNLHEEAPGQGETDLQNLLAEAAAQQQEAVSATQEKALVRDLPVGEAARWGVLPKVCSGSANCSEKKISQGRSGSANCREKKYDQANRDDRRSTGPSL